MDVLQAIRMDYTEEDRLLDEIINDFEPKDPECVPEKLFELNDRFRSNKIAADKVLHNEADLVVLHRDEVDRLESMNNRIEVLLSDLLSDNCADERYLEALATLKTELRTRNSFAAQLFDVLDNELTMDVRGKLFTEYERYRADVAEGAPFQERSIPFARSPRHQDDLYH